MKNEKFVNLEMSQFGNLPFIPKKSKYLFRKLSELNICELSTTN